MNIKPKFNFIPLTIRGQYALIPVKGAGHAKVDPQHAIAVGQHQWHAIHGAYTTYAYTNGVRRKDFEAPGFYMHQMIVPTADRLDHADGDGLNNRSRNLRDCTNSQNVANGRRHKDAKHRFRGVHWSSLYQNWQVQCQHKHVGAFDNEEDAARAYDATAKVAFGSFARLNFPENF